MKSVSSLPVRVAVTVLVPALLVVLGDRIPLPGVPGELFAQAGARPIGLFSLGVVPFVWGFWVVEVVAFFVPRLSRLRHDDPSGRAKLTRAAVILGVVFAALQSFAMLLTLQDYAGDRLPVSAPIVMASLMGSACVHYVVAQLVSRQRLLNGFLALVAAALVAHTAGEVTKVADAVGIALVALGGAVIMGATWIVLRGAGNLPWKLPLRAEAGTPYRDARQLVLHPDVPLPASSFPAYSLAHALLGLPLALASIHVPFPDWSPHLADDRVETAALLALTLLVAWIFARLLHRPGELASLAERLGAKAGRKFAGEMRASVAAALPPTFLYFAVVVIAGRATQVGALTFAIVVPIVVDLVHAIRLAQREPAFVPIWDERRAAAIPILRAALAGHGIRTEVQGAAATSFWQLFVPIAPAVLLAPKKQAERAKAILGHLLTGSAAPAPSPTPPPAAPLAEQPWARGRRTALLGGAVALAVVAFVSLRAHRAPPARSAADGPRARLEIVRIDDTIQPLARVDDADVPEDLGILLVDERAPLGATGDGDGRFAEVRIAAGETTLAARDRLATWLASFELPHGARFGFQDQVDESPAGPLVTGVRSFVLAGEPIVTTDDVTEAHARDPHDGTPVYVALTLSSSAAKRFEDATREWRGRRIAILVDDEIVVAPVIRSAIGGGHVSITLGAGDPATQRERAERLALRLAP